MEKLRQRNQLDLNTISHFPYGFDASMNTSGANNANALQQMMAMQQAMAMGMTGTSPNGMQPMFMMPMASPGGTAAGQQHPFFFMPTSAGDAAQNFGASVQQQQQQQQMMISPTLMQQFVDANQQPRQNDVLQDEHGEKDVPMTPMTEMAMAAFGRSSTALASGKPSRTSRRHTKTAAVTAPSSNNAPYSTRRSSYMTSAPFTAGTLFEEGISAWGTSTEGGLNLVDMGGSGDDGDVAGTPTRSLTFQY